MRIKLTFHADSSPLALPLSYYHCLQGLIYNLMSSPLAGQLHEKEETKPFVFSSLSGPYLLDRENKLILFSDQVSFHIASSDSYLLLTILSSIVSKPGKFALLGQKIVFDDARVERYFLEEQESYIIETMSPITLHKSFEEDGRKKTYYFSPNEPDFNEALNGNFLRKASLFGSDVPKTPISLLPSGNVKKAVALYKNFTIVGFNGVFRFLGKKEQLLFLLDQGLGDRNSEGFGMFKVINETRRPRR